MGDNLLIKKEKNIGPTKGKRYYDKIQELIILLHQLRLTISLLRPKKIKNEESIQIFHPQIVDTRDTGQYMPDDRS